MSLWGWGIPHFILPIGLWIQIEEKLGVDFSTYKEGYYCTYLLINLRSGLVYTQF